MIDRSSNTLEQGQGYPELDMICREYRAIALHFCDYRAPQKWSAIVLASIAST